MYKIKSIFENLFVIGKLEIYLNAFFDKVIVYPDVAVIYLFLYLAPRTQASGNNIANNDRFINLFSSDLKRPFV
jgi:hypothetical protein